MCSHFKRELSESAQLGSIANNVDITRKAFDYKPIRKKIYSVRNAIRKHKNRDGSSGLASSRVHSCGMPLGRVSVGKHFEHNSYAFGGLETCRSLWACPVCRAKALGQRSKELIELNENWIEECGKVSLLTLTGPHDVNQSLKELIGYTGEKTKRHYIKLKDFDRIKLTRKVEYDEKVGRYYWEVKNTGFTGALRRLRQSRVWKNFKSKIGYLGDIRVMEITYGEENGWHPHFHLAIYHTEEIDYLAAKETLHAIWQDCYKKAGFESLPSYKHGIDIREENKADYIAKWGSPQELSSPSAKKGRGNNYSISEIESALLGESENLDKEFAAHLLREYYKTTKGRQMLIISGKKGWFKELLGTDFKTDDEAIDEAEKDFKQNYEELGTISAKTYRKLLYNNDIHQALTILEQKGLDSFLSWLEKTRNGTRREFIPGQIILN